MKTTFFTSMTIALTAAAAFAQNSNNAAIEKTLRDLDTQWAQAFASKDVDKTVSYYSDDAIVLPPNEPVQTSKDAIRKEWKTMIDTGSSLTWSATRVEVSKSGDMAYVSGTYRFTGKDDTGKAIDEKGKYLEVWEKKSDGSWKCGADMWNSDAPPAPTAK